MKQQFNHATIKIWFTAGSISRNLYNVTEMDWNNNDVLRIMTNGEVILMNWRNINTIEIIEEGVNERI